MCNACGMVCCVEKSLREVVPYQLEIGCDSTPHSVGMPMR